MNHVGPKDWQLIISYFFVIMVPIIPRRLIIHADNTLYHTLLLNFLFYTQDYILLHKTLPNILFPVFEISTYLFNMVLDTTVWQSHCRSLSELVYRRNVLDLYYFHVSLSVFQNVRFCTFSSPELCIYLSVPFCLYVNTMLSLYLHHWVICSNQETSRYLV
jgi:hypothetical protein